jgi:hypothetical protein
LLGISDMIAMMTITFKLNTIRHVDISIIDLEELIEDVRKEGSSGKRKGTAGVYGTTNSLPAGPVKDLLCVYTDVTMAA